MFGSVLAARLTGKPKKKRKLAGGVALQNQKVKKSLERQQEKAPCFDLGTGTKNH